MIQENVLMYRNVEPVIWDRPHKNNFVAELRKRHPEITTIVQNINEANPYFYLKVKEGHPGSLQ